MARAYVAVERIIRKQCRSRKLYDTVTR
jgi:hypothetical protein